MVQKPAHNVLWLENEGIVVVDHDWSISRRIRDAVPTPLFLSGGLKPENVSEALAEVAPCEQTANWMNANWRTFSPQSLRSMPTEFQI